MAAPAADDYVSTILRLHDPSRLDRLELALTSLCGQRHARLSPVIALQDFSEADEDKTKRIAHRLPWRRECRLPEIVNLRGLGPGDHRTKLMNAGIKAATGNYVGFLDFDDYLYPNAYTSLLSRIEASGKKAAFGTVLIADVDGSSPGGACSTKSPFPIAKSKYELFTENIYPIHSFLMKADVAKSVSIPEHLAALEDYYFLLSTLKDHDWDDELTRRQPIGEYLYWSDGSNTVAANANRGEKGQPWREAREEVARLKASLHVKLPLPNFLSLLEEDGQPKSGASKPQSGLEPSLIEVIRTFLPVIGLWSRADGGIDGVSWNGCEADVTGSIKLPHRHGSAASGLLFTARASQLRPSYRYLATIGFTAHEFDVAARQFGFSARIPLTRDHIRKGRDQLVLFVLTAEGRLYKAPNAIHPRLNAQPAVAAAA